MSEIWKPVVGYEGAYEVSDQGRVRSLDRVVLRADAGRGAKQRRRGKVLRGSLDSNGYPTVAISGYVVAIHILSAAAFIGRRPKGQQVRHKDGSRDNGLVSNLEYGTQSQNTLDSVRHGTHRAILPAEKLRQIVAARGTSSAYKVANRLGVGHNVVSCIWRGDHYTSRPT